jgi:DNA/RNA-binding domain of Phe-tRNA-synthetase-like protein
MKKFVADKEFWDIFPEAVIGVISFDNVQESKELVGAEADEVKKILDDANVEAKKFLVSDTISENPVVAAWREAYQKFPTKKGARCSMENLLKRVLHEKPVGHIAPSVDITNAISLKHAFPIGCENKDAIDGDIRLGVMKGGEDFLPIGSDKQEPPLEGELAYYDNTGVICRCWNWRDGQRTEVNDDTRNEVVILECIEPDRVDELKAALEELQNLMEKYLDAKTVVCALVDKDHQEVEI